MTNWHNVTGKNPLTGTQLSRTLAEPDCLVLVAHHPELLGPRVAVVLPLNDDHGMPLWYEHPNFGKKVDVVALPLPSQRKYRTFPINKLTQMPVASPVGSEVFILGFPRAMMGPMALPIWKRAGIASEPQVCIDGLPKFFVDTASREGMSGAPVIRRVVGAYPDDQGNFHVGPAVSTRFLGVYSGRLGADDEFKAQLGLVWRHTVVEEILAGQRRGSREFEASIGNL